MRSPQEIKDQEFQVKFRGFDPLEVRSYLDEIADEFFALQEKADQALAEQKVLIEQNFDLSARYDALVDEKEALAAQVSLGDESKAKIEEKVEKGYRYKDEQIAEITGQKTALEERIAALEKELGEKDAQLEEEGARLRAKDASLAESQTKISHLESKVDLLGEQIVELKQEGLDFKSTILAAQQFAEDVKGKAQVESERILAEAQDLADEFANEQKDIQAALIAETERLRLLHSEVREELAAKFNSMLASLEMFDRPLQTSMDNAGEGSVESFETDEPIEDLNSLLDEVDGTDAAKAV